MGFLSGPWAVHSPRQLSDGCVTRMRCAPRFSVVTDCVRGLQRIACARADDSSGAQGVEVEVVDVGVDADVQDVPRLVPVGSAVSVGLHKVLLPGC